MKKKGDETAPIYKHSLPGGTNPGPSVGESRHEKIEEKVPASYPAGMHNTIKQGIEENLEVNAIVGTTTFDEPEHGLTEEVLTGTDVLVWWGHIAHHEVSDEVVERVHRHVLAGMGLVVLHSGHWSKIFVKLMGTTSTSTFATMPDSTAPLRVVFVGAGGMGRAWLGALIENSDVDLVGVVDLNLPLARTSLADLDHAHVPVGSTVSEIATLTRVDAVVNATVPEAHHAANSEALFAGIPVLCEKPIAPTVAQAMSLAAASEATGQLLMTSQSRRYYASLSVFRNQVRTLGQLGLATTEFFKAQRFGGFRDEMDHVLLVDMAIHTFDTARYVLDSDPVAVFCEEFNPRWSWYAGSVRHRDLRVRKRYPLRLRRKLVQRRAGDIMERKLARERLPRLRELGW